jgi:hypothetical protein
MQSIGSPRYWRDVTSMDNPSMITTVNFEWILDTHVHMKSSCLCFHTYATASYVHT